MPDFKAARADFEPAGPRVVHGGGYGQDLVNMQTEQKQLHVFPFQIPDSVDGKLDGVHSKLAGADILMWIVCPWANGLTGP